VVVPGGKKYSDGNAWKLILKETQVRAWAVGTVQKEEEEEEKKRRRKGKRRRSWRRRRRKQEE